MKKRIALRREDKNKWERRTPLIPSHVRELIQQYGMDVWLQPSPIRIFKDEDYLSVGACISEDVTSCPIILSVKEIPLHFFESGKTYIFFSHTIKGQPYNMPMLRKMMELKCTLLDYECIKDEKGRRLVFFGQQAGQAGMIETLRAFGKKAAADGIGNPFQSLKQPWEYASLVEAKEDIRRIAWEINRTGLDRSLVPLICGITGYGKVSQGAQEITSLLPVDKIAPSRIKEFFNSGNYASNRIYETVFEEKDMVEKTTGDDAFELQDYYDNPAKYRSVFARYLPFLSLLTHCIYWTPDYPRFITRQHLKKLWETVKSPRLKALGDITCDIEGSIECTIKSTSPERPVFLYNPITGSIKNSINGTGVLVMAVDNLPAEISLESSISFSQSLFRLIPQLVHADFSGSLESCSLTPSLKNAVILYKGSLTPRYRHMEKYL